MKNITRSVGFKNFVAKYWTFLFIGLVWFIFASPYFLKGLVPYASTYQVNFFAPWSHYEKFWGPIKNNAMPDIHGQIYPWKKFTIDMWKSGQIPLWNPYSFSSNPHLANFQTAVLSPFNLLFFIIPFIDAWSIIVLLQPLLAGLFTYLMMRQFQISKVGSLISSVAFMFCGFVVVWMAYGTLSMAIAFLPLATFSIERSFRSNSLLSLVLVSMSLPLSFFSGHFQTSLYFVIFIFSFFLFKTITTKLYRKAAIVGLFLLFGILLSLPQVLPSVEFYRNSVRSEIFLTKGEGIPFNYLVNIFAPDFFGNPVTRNDWFGYYAEWASFIGVIPFVLAFFSLFSKKHLFARFFFVAGLIALTLAIDSPLQSLIGALKIPVLSTSTPSRIIVLFSFSFAIAAGFGVDTVKEFIAAKRVKKILFVFAVFSVVLFALWMLLIAGNTMTADKELIAKRNLVLPTLLFLGSFLIVGISLFNKKFLLFTIFFLLFAMSFDSLRFAQKWMPFDSRELVYPRVPVIDAIKKYINGGRIFGNLGAEVTTYHGIPSIEGYDPLYIDRYGSFIRGAGKGEFLQGERSVVKLDRGGLYTDRVLDLLGVTLIFNPIPDTNQGWAYPVWNKKERYDLIYGDNKFQLFRNKQVLPRALLYHDYEVLDNPKNIVTRFYSDDFDFRNTILLEDHPEKEVKAIKKDSEHKGKANIRQYEPNEIIIDVTTDSSALLFLSDNFYPGWKAYVDGQRVKIHRANFTFRAVEVEKGRHKVRFYYDPISFKMGIYAAGVGLLAFLLTIRILKKKRYFG